MFFIARRKICKFKGAVLHKFRIQTTVRREIDILDKNTVEHITYPVYRRGRINIQSVIALCRVIGSNCRVAVDRRGGGGGKIGGLGRRNFCRIRRGGGEILIGILSAAYR